MTIKADIRVMLPETNTPEARRGKEQIQRETHKKTGMANGVKMRQKVK